MGRYKEGAKGSEYGEDECTPLVKLMLDDKWSEKEILDNFATFIFAVSCFSKNFMLYWSLLSSGLYEKYALAKVAISRGTNSTRIFFEFFQKSISHLMSNRRNTNRKIV